MKQTVGNAGKINIHITVVFTDATVTSQETTLVNGMEFKKTDKLAFLVSTDMAETKQKISQN